MSDENTPNGNTQAPTPTPTPVSPQPAHSVKGNSSVVVGVLAVVIGIGIGILGANALGANKSAEQAAVVNKTGDAMQKDAIAAPAAVTTDTKAADLRVLLNALEREHVNLAAAATRRGFQGDPDFDAAAGELDKNSVAIAGAVGSVYGQEAEAQFLEIWRSHITFFVNYTVAAKGGDKAGMDKAVQDLGGYVESISDFLSKANPNLPREAVHALVSEHVTLLKGAVDAYGAKDYAGSYAKEHEANEQIGTIADALSGAIVKQYPEKFQ